MNLSKAEILSACVLGDPVDHSLSPILHEYWIKTLGLKARYTRCHSTKQTFRKTVTKQFARPGFVGMNVTLPHKQAALELADQGSKNALKAGAANLLYRKNDLLFADNTDIDGFLAPLLSLCPIDQWRGGKIVIIGAGGAARAALIGAMQLRPQSLIILNRTDARALTLSRDFGDPVCAKEWAKRQRALEGADLVINASAAGMKGQDPLDLSLQGLKQNALIYDLVYTPLVTPLLMQARENGLLSLNGLDMLIAQARPSFEVFYGTAAPVNVGARQALIDVLEGKP